MLHYLAHYLLSQLIMLVIPPVFLLHLVLRVCLRMESLLNGKDRYNWPPCTDFNMKNEKCLFYKNKVFQQGR